MRALLIITGILFFSSICLSTAESPPVLPGIEQLFTNRLQLIRDKNVAVVVNNTSVDLRGKHLVDLLLARHDVKLKAIFSPEHGLEGLSEERIIKDATYKNVPVYSLFGESLKPTQAQLADIDVIIFDIQDIGTRYYTYAGTLGFVMEEAAKAKTQVIVLDRPNPLGGHWIDGPITDTARLSFYSFVELPIVHGLTIGELARLFKYRKRIEVDLQVIKLKGWQRQMRYQETGIPWVNPSPNMRSLEAAWLYPGIGLLENSDISVGRGTDRPFQIICAPWINSLDLWNNLATENLTGITITPIQVIPSKDKFAGEKCNGVEILIDRSREIAPVLIGLKIAVVLKKLYPQQFNSAAIDNLLANHKSFQALLQADTNIEKLQLSWKEDLQAFAEQSKEHFLY